MRRPRVLVVDDSPEVHRLLSVRLVPEVLELTYATSAADGLRLALELLPDLVLLDVDLPDGSGFEACRELKADARTSSLPVIFLTGEAGVDFKVEGFEAGGIDYITKPFEAAELRARVRAALRTKRYQDLLARHAQIDALTGVWNRRYFDRRLEEEVAAVRRYGRRVSLVLFDLDHFKTLNDTHGHPFGDRVLQVVGEHVVTFVRECDAACRIGGEEFALILTETPADRAFVVADRLRVHLADLRHDTTKGVVTVTASFGIAEVEGSVATAAALFEAADAALYRAKRDGRNRVAPAAQ